MAALDPMIVTGSTGFVGRALLTQAIGAEVTPLHFGSADWRSRMRSTDFCRATVFHLAARVHGGGGMEGQYLEDNRDKTAALARAAAAGGARRLVFLSTIKVNGEETRDRPFRADDIPAPQDAYGRSKWEGEIALAEIAKAAGLEYCVVRSPLVYGPGVGGNLLSLLRLADSPLPLPFASLENRRSFIHVEDLVRLLLECAVLPQAAGKTFLAAHRSPVSTRSLVSGIRDALGRPQRLFPLAPAALQALAALAGQSGPMKRLTASLEVDAEPATRELHWTAQVCLQSAIEDMVRSYRSDRRA
jgi:nucleoside-diphosphate-sugar epimerase